MAYTNFIKIPRRFRDYYVYVDVFNEDGGYYEIDKLIDITNFFKIRFLKKEFINPNSIFRFCVAKIRHKDNEMFETILSKLNRSLMLQYNSDYMSFLEALSEYVSEKKSM